MATRRKATPATSDAVEIHRIIKPGDIVAIYERHEDGSVTRRLEKVTAAPEGGEAA